MSLNELIINGKPQKVRAATLEELLSELGYEDGRLATAVDGAFVARSQRAATALKPGARVEIVAPRQGG